MDKYGIVVVTDTDEVKLVELDDYHLTLDMLYKYTTCDTIQILRLPNYKPNPYAMMVIDDNGKVNHRPINKVGTVLYGAFPLDFIVGDLLLGTSWTPNPNDEPDIYALPYNEAVEMYNFCNSLLSEE